MTIVDTSVWIEHFRKPNPPLIKLLEDGQVLTHPFVIGELACGQFKSRKEFIGLLLNLPGINVITFAEVLKFIEKFNLFGKGLGYVDMHLLASAYYSKLELLTLDKKLQKEFSKL